MINHINLLATFASKVNITKPFGMNCGQLHSRKSVITNKNYVAQNRNARMNDVRRLVAELEIARTQTFRFNGINLLALQHPLYGVFFAIACAPGSLARCHNNCPRRLRTRAGKRYKTSRWLLALNTSQNAPR